MKDTPSLYKIEVESKLQDARSSWEQSDRIYILANSQEDARRTMMGRCHPQKTKITAISFHREVNFISDNVIDRILNVNKEKYMEELKAQKKPEPKSNMWRNTILTG